MDKTAPRPQQPSQRRVIGVKLLSAVSGLRTTLMQQSFQLLRRALLQQWIGGSGGSSEARLDPGLRVVGSGENDRLLATPAPAPAPAPASGPLKTSRRPYGPPCSVFPNAPRPSSVHPPSLPGRDRTHAPRSERDGSRGSSSETNASNSFTSTIRPSRRSHGYRPLRRRVLRHAVHDWPEAPHRRRVGPGRAYLIGGPAQKERLR